MLRTLMLSGSEPDPGADPRGWSHRAQEELERLDSSPTSRPAVDPVTLAGMPADELRRHFTEERRRRRVLRERRAWEWVARLADEANALPPGRDREERLGRCAEITTAVRRGRDSPVPERIDVAWGAVTFWQHALNPVGRGRRPAVHPARGPGPEADAVHRPSTFWTPPGDVGSRDLGAGFGRGRMPDHDDIVWSYAGPKTGTGAHPGFEVRTGGRRLKVKFAEVHSEPFASRVFDALGYHVPVVDHAPRIRVAYDRRLLREFHQRTELVTRLQLLGFIPVHHLRYQRRHDPFDFVRAARLVDGTEITSDEFRRRLLPDSQGIRFAEDQPEAFDREFEARVAWLVFEGVNVEVDDGAGHAVGRWGYGDLDHADRQELRGLALLAAWLAWFDSRPVNTRLRVLAPAGDLRHEITDLGGCLGRSPGFMIASWERPEHFSDRFTRPERRQGPGRMTIPFRITGYQPVVETPAFRAMTVGDARWMARWIGGLSEAQLADALAAAGFGAADARWYLDRLVARRDTMIRDLGLGSEIAPLRPGSP